MPAISSPVLHRLSAAAAMPYATIERTTRPLILLDRWPNRSRRTLLASDLASLVNAVISLQQANEAAEADTILRTLEYKATWPATAKQAPALGSGTWGQLLERLIEQAPPVSAWKSKPATDDVEVDCLPHVIEASFNPTSIVLVWWGPDGTPKRRDFYGPAANSPRKPQPYGTAALLIRKAFVQPELIQIAGEILRDFSSLSADAEEVSAAPARARRTR